MTIGGEILVIVEVLLVAGRVVIELAEVAQTPTVTAACFVTGAVTPTADTSSISNIRFDERKDNYTETGLY